MCPEVAFQLLTKMDNSNEVVGVAVRWDSRRKGGRSKAEAAAAAVVARVGCVVVEVVAVESAEDGSSSSNAAGVVSAKRPAVGAQAPAVAVILELSLVISTVAKSESWQEHM